MTATTTRQESPQGAQDARSAGREYVRTCRAAAREDAYERVEPLAWQKLVDELARAGVVVSSGGDA